MPNEQDEERAGQPVGKVENEQERGRYGRADQEKPHLSPEVEPARGRDMPVDVPPGMPGMLPENAGRSRDDRVSDQPQNEVSGKNRPVPRKESEKGWDGAKLRDD